MLYSFARLANACALCSAEEEDGRAEPRVWEALPAGAGARLLQDRLQVRQSRRGAAARRRGWATFKHFFVQHLGYVE